MAVSVYCIWKKRTTNRDPFLNFFLFASPPSFCFCEVRRPNATTVHHLLVSTPARRKFFEVFYQWPV